MASHTKSELRAAARVLAEAALGVGADAPAAADPSPPPSPLLFDGEADERVAA